MLYAGLDLSRKRLDFHLLDAEGATVDVGASPPDADGLRALSQREPRAPVPCPHSRRRADGRRVRWVRSGSDHTDPRCPIVTLPRNADRRRPCLL